MREWKDSNLKIGDLEVEAPIIQGGMGVGISLSGLASAVANEGGIGVISAALIGMNEFDFDKQPQQANARALRKEIRLTREQTDGIIGVNIMNVLNDYENMVRISIEEEVDVIFVGAGLPLDLPSFLTENSKTKLVPIVSSGRAAKVITKRWLSSYNYAPDAIVVEGPMAGGHLGFSLDQIDGPEYELEKLVCDTLKVTKDFEEKAGKEIPVIAAGGVYNGEDIYKFLKLGASGVQMGTRFVTTMECDASTGFKRAYIDANEDDIVIIKSPVGLPGRAVKNAFIEKTLSPSEKKIICAHNCMAACKPDKRPYCIANSLINAKQGILDKGFAFAGANAYKATKVTSVKKLMNELADEYEQARLKDFDKTADKAYSKCMKTKKIT